jgi:DNA primase
VKKILSITDEIKQKADIVEVISGYVQLTKSGKTLRAPCPFHSEKKPSFFVYPDQQTWHCFGACNTGGDVFSFVMKKEGLEFGDALRLLAEKYGVQIPSQAKSAAEDQARDKILQANMTTAQYYHNLLLHNPGADKARRYLEKRGVNAQSISDFQIGYSLPAWEALKQYLTEKGFNETDLLDSGLIIRSEDNRRTHDRFRDHLMFPIMDERGRVTGFGARVLEAEYSGPKYINSPQTRVFDKSGSLYGIHLAKSGIRQADLAVLVEGYMDVIIAHQYGFNNVIAPMGVAITERQINQLKKLTHKIALALDPDSAGEEAAMRCVAYENSLDTEVKVISLPAGQDPDEVIKADKSVWENAVAKAIPAMEFTIRTLAGKMNLDSGENRAHLVKQLLPILATQKNSTHLSNNLQILAKLSGTSQNNLEIVLSSYKPDTKKNFAKTTSINRAIRTVSSNPVEEYLLAILLQHPEIAPKTHDLLVEYFENSENRAIFEVWKGAIGVTADLTVLIDNAIQDHFKKVLSRYLPGNDFEERYTDCVLRLRERYLRNLKKKQEEALTLEAESGDKAAVLTKLQEQGTTIDQELMKIFAQRAKTQGKEIHEKR